MAEACKIRSRSRRKPAAWHYSLHIEKSGTGGVARFYRQKPLLTYVVDFYCPKAKLVIELDGGQHYGEIHQQNDCLRDAELNNLGLMVLRFDNRQVMKELPVRFSNSIKGKIVCSI